MSTLERVDYLYRISIKCLIKDSQGNVLVVKESGRNYWDLPGGGMDHGEDIRSTIVRELREEVNFEGEFEFSIKAVEDPVYLEKHDFWQTRLIYTVMPSTISFSSGVDADATGFRDPMLFKNSNVFDEKKIHEYSFS
jgi:8-oxo-dGTP pyrophosphatase MutT (NUDIX family)